MEITMSNFLMENDISDACCDDIAMEQYNAEMEVLTALSEAYFKQLQMVEYFQEGELADSAKVAGVAAGIGAIGFGAAALWIITLPFRIIIALIKGIINIIKRIYNMFRKVREKDIQRAIDKLKKMSDDEKKEFRLQLQNINTNYCPIGLLMSKAKIDVFLKEFNELTSSDEPVKDFDKWKLLESALDKQFTYDIDQSLRFGFDVKGRNTDTGETKQYKFIYFGYQATIQYLETLKYTVSQLPTYKETEKKFESILKKKEEELKRIEKEGGENPDSVDSSEIKKKMDEIRRIGQKFIKCLNEFVSMSFKWYYAVTHQVFKSDIEAHVNEKYIISD
jgi:hypothetical protein